MFILTFKKCVSNPTYYRLIYDFKIDDKKYTVESRLIKEDKPAEVLTALIEFTNLLEDKLINHSRNK